MDFILKLNDVLNNFLLNAGIMAPLFASLLIILEGVLAFLPLFLFITINILTMGTFFGGIVSWICTIIGSTLAFLLFRLKLNFFFQSKIKKNVKIKKFMKKLDKLKFVYLVLIISILFTPSFFVNVAAGLSNIPVKKYLYALIVGKVCVVWFWGFIGMSLVDCLTNPIVMLKIFIMLLIMYVIGQMVNRKFELDKRF